MTRVVCSANPAHLPGMAGGALPVLLYGPQSRNPRGGSIGNQLVDAVARLGEAIPQAAFDFLTIALAVTAADTFLVREECAADGWSREIELVVALGDPDPWRARKSELEATLRFLSGDMWRIDLRDNGPRAPRPYTRRNRRKTTALDGRDCACLFSGGLDSAVGALDLIAAGRSPVLVSHSYRGDKSRQEAVAGKLPVRPPRFAAAAHPVSTTRKDTTMRTRSLNFLAYGAVVASALAARSGSHPVDLFVPENGFIALNAPLTPRRIGALSTRTTHPHFLGQAQRLFDGLGIPARIVNPYRFATKGEMLEQCADKATLARLAIETVSCGRWKRPPQRQCGRCVPCLIRRAAFHRAGLVDATGYLSPNLSTVLSNRGHRDDLLALMLAATGTATRVISRWIMQSGPLPEGRDARDRYGGVFRRGLREVGTYLRSEGLSL